MAFELTPIGGVNYGALGQTGTPLTNSWLSGQSSGQSLGGFSLAPQSPITSPSVLSSTPLDWNVGTMQLGLSGIQTLGNLWTSWNATDLAKKNYNMQHNLSQANLDNQVQTTNNALEDKINSRYVTEGKSSADASNYLSSHELKKTVI